MNDINKTLEERGKEYGKFINHAEITQRLKHVVKDGLQSSGVLLTNDMQEALDMICHKIGRIVNGNPSNIDSWHDISGYATLVENRLIQEKNKHSG